MEHPRTPIESFVGEAVKKAARPPTPTHLDPKALEAARTDVPQIEVIGSERITRFVTTYLTALVPADVAGLAPLEWVTTWGPGSQDHGDEWYQAATPFGSYDVERRDGHWQWRYCFDEYYDEDTACCADLEEGQALAQAHWNERIADIVSPAALQSLSAKRAADKARIAELGAGLKRIISAPLIDHTDPENNPASIARSLLNAGGSDAN